MRQSRTAPAANAKVRRRERGSGPRSRRSRRGRWPPAAESGCQRRAGRSGVQGQRQVGRALRRAWAMLRRRVHARHPHPPSSRILETPCDSCVTIGIQPAPSAQTVTPEPPRSRIARAVGPAIRPGSAGTPAGHALGQHVHVVEPDAVDQLAPPACSRSFRCFSPTSRCDTSSKRSQNTGASKPWPQTCAVQQPRGLGAWRPAAGSVPSWRSVRVRSCSVSHSSATRANGQRETVHRTDVVHRQRGARRHRVAAELGQQLGVALG